MTGEPICTKNNDENTGYNMITEYKNSEATLYSCL